MLLPNILHNNFTISQARIKHNSIRKTFFRLQNLPRYLPLQVLTVLKPNLYPIWMLPLNQSQAISKYICTTIITISYFNLLSCPHNRIRNIKLLSNNQLNALYNVTHRFHPDTFVKKVCYYQHSLLYVDNCYDSAVV